MGNRRARLIDLAERAGVSLATVDRVLNNRPGVKAGTVARVREAAEALNYRPNLMAQSLARRETFRLDIVLPGGPSTYIQLLARSINDARTQLADFPIDPRIHTFEPLNAGALAAQLRRIGEDSHGVAMFTFEHPDVRAAVDALADAGVPTVTLLSDLNATQRANYVGFDNLLAGRTAGYLIGRFLAGRRGEVALLTGGLQYRSHQNREMGFRQVVSGEFDQLAIVDLEETKSDFDVAYTRTRGLLERYPSLVGIYNVGGGHRGVARALVESGRADDVVFIGHELTPHTREFLLKGVMDAVIAQDPVRLARRAMQILVEHSLGQTVAPDAGTLPAEIYLRENVP